ncbi:MAG: 6-bladed beta-propeller [Gemmatimonadaceae bacterium]|nr:6-bladed beta-propeller [Gemmatimonadaceae bacterium]
MTLRRASLCALAWPLVTPSGDLAKVSDMSALGHGDATEINAPAAPQRADTLVVRGNIDVSPTAVRGLVPVWKVGEPLFEIGEINELAVAPDGRVYVWDWQTQSLWQLSANGRQVKKIGRKGSGPGEYGQLSGIAVRRDGKAVVWDGGNARLNVYDANGRSAGTWRLLSGTSFSRSALTATLDNRVLMRTRVRRPKERDYPTAVIAFDSLGVPRDTMFIPWLPSDPPLVARSASGASTATLDLPYGTFVRFAPSPLGHLVYGPGRPYVVHTMFKGQPIRIERVFTPIPVSREERDVLRRSNEGMMRSTQPNWMWTGRDIPDTKPAYRGFLIGVDGRIWVELSAESERYETDAPGTSPTTPLPRVVRFRAKERRWDVFEPDGRFVARVVAPRLFTAHAARADTVWGVVRDEDDVPSVVKMRIRPAQQRR